jgi:hypothetical protein
MKVHTNIIPISDVCSREQDRHFTQITSRRRCRCKEWVLHTLSVCSIMQCNMRYYIEIYVLSGSTIFLHIISQMKRFSEKR